MAQVILASRHYEAFRHVGRQAEHRPGVFTEHQLALVHSSLRGCHLSLVFLYHRLKLVDASGQLHPLIIAVFHNVSISLALDEIHLLCHLVLVKLVVLMMASYTGRWWWCVLCSGLHDLLMRSLVEVNQA